MSNKTLSILSYITIIGWLVAYFKSKDQAVKNDLVTYHLKQGFGFFIFSLVVNIAMNTAIILIPSIFFLSYFSIILFALLIFGIINAANEQRKPIPVIGLMFENKFNFIG